MTGDRGDGGDGGDGGGEVDQGEVSTIRLGMLESSGFRKYSTLLVIQLSSRVVHMLRIFFNQRTPKIKLSGDILVLSSDDVSPAMESSLHFNPIKLQSSTGSN